MASKDSRLSAFLLGFFTCAGLTLGWLLRKSTARASFTRVLFDASTRLTKPAKAAHTTRRGERTVEASPHPLWYSALCSDDIRRYKRHLLCRGFSVDAQKKLNRARVLLVGAGGLGGPCAAYLCAAGVETLTIVDGDVVELSNLTRQVFYSEEDVLQHRKKAAVLASHCSHLNSSTQTVAVEEYFTTENAVRLVKAHDIVVCCVDGKEARYLVHDSAALAGKPVVSASSLRWEGQLTSYLCHKPTAPCLRCLFPMTEEPEQDDHFAESTCDEAGVIGCVVGAMGVLQALETIKVIAGISESLGACNRLLLFDGEGIIPLRSCRVRAQRREDCPICVLRGSGCSSSESGCKKALARLHPTYSPGNVCKKKHAEKNNPAVEASGWQPSDEEETERAVLDVRPVHHQRVSGITSAVSFPARDIVHGCREEVERCVTQAVGPECCRIDVICRRGNDSAKVVQYLLEDTCLSDRFTIRNVKGGYEEWLEQRNAERSSTAACV